VLDLTHLITGPFATRYFGDFGADVVKIEPPWGEPGRRLAPFQGDDPHPEKSGIFFFLNRNKRGVTLNLKTEAGRAIFRRLAEGADLVVENFRPGVIASLGFDYQALSAINPAISLASISNFGQTGPYRDFKGSELVLYAMGGEMYSNGTAEREPLKMAGTAALIQVGAAAAAGAIAAVFGAKFHGFGQHVDISIVEALLSSPDRRVPAILSYQWTHGGLTNRRSVMDEVFLVGTYPCADGFIEIFLSVAHWPQLVEMLGRPEALLDPKFDTIAGRVENKPEVDAHFFAWLAEHTKVEVWRAAQAAHVLCAPLYTTKDLLEDPHFNQRGFWTKVRHAVMGEVTMPGVPMKLTDTPVEMRRPAPLLGQHNGEVLGELGYGAEELALLRQEGAI
jgi:crotonobetainyl-CoA:carnitine CoA-transferase CaiB-like acyl-CoA transferase